MSVRGLLQGRCLGSGVKSLRWYFRGWDYEEATVGAGHGRSTSIRDWPDAREG